MNLNYKKIAIAFLKEAYQDFEAVDILIEHDVFNLSIYHAQQAVEKLLKSCLAIEGEVGIFKHEIFPYFKRVFESKLDQNSLDKLEECVSVIEEEWAKPRYPGWDETGDTVWTPSEAYTKEDALDRKKRMKKVFEILIEMLKSHYEIEIPQ